MISLCLLGGLAIGNGFAQTPSKPNILLIIADDCSYYDIGCFGAVNNKTPHIDALARQGIKFNSAYNSVSMSTPTRHCVYTGMYPMHHGGYANHSSVNADVKSLPTYLGNLGYRVGLAGKWHIKPLANFPFEDVPGFPKGCTSPNTDYHTKGIEKFMERDASQPFCLVLASINSHAPWTGGDASVFDRKKLQLPPQFIDTEVTREYYARYLAEVGLLDQQVGDAMQILKEKNLLQNTLVISYPSKVRNLLEPNGPIGVQVSSRRWWLPGRVSLNPVWRLPLLCNMKTFFLHLSMLQAERCLT